MMKICKVMNQVIERPLQSQEQPVALPKPKGQNIRTQRGKGALWNLFNCHRNWTSIP